MKRVITGRFMQCAVTARFMLAQQCCWQLLSLVGKSNTLDMAAQQQVLCLHIY